jgi:hypothetical protein
MALPVVLQQATVAVSRNILRRHARASRPIFAPPSLPDCGKDREGQSSLGRLAQFWKPSASLDWNSPGSKLPALPHLQPGRAFRWRFARRRPRKTGKAFCDAGLRNDVRLARHGAFIRASEYKKRAGTTGARRVHQEYFEAVRDLNAHGISVVMLVYAAGIKARRACSHPRSCPELYAGKN